MKKQKIKELKKKPLVNLQKLLDEKREKLNQIKFDLFTGKIQNIKEIKRLKKDIAQILTIININKNNA